MAITATSLLTGTNTGGMWYGGLPSYYFQTAAVALTAKKFYILSCEVKARFGTVNIGPDPVQTGATWTPITWTAYDTPIGNQNAAIFAWRCQPASNVASAVIKIPTEGVYDGFGGWTHAQWHLNEFTGTYDDSANNGAGVVLQSPTHETNGTPATSISVTFAAFGTGSGSVTIAAASDTPGSISPATGYTELSETIASSDALEASFAATATDPAGASWPNSKNAGVIGIELKVGSTPPPSVVLPRLLHIPFKDRLFTLALDAEGEPIATSMQAISSMDFDNMKVIERWANNYITLAAAESKCNLYIPHKHLPHLDPGRSFDNWKEIERWGDKIVTGICTGTGFLAKCNLYIPHKTVINDLVNGRITLDSACAREFDNYKTVENWANRLHRGEC